MATPRANWSKLAKVAAVVALVLVGVSGVARLPHSSRAPSPLVVATAQAQSFVRDPGTEAEVQDEAAQHPAAKSNEDTWLETMIKKLMYSLVAFFGYVTLSLFNFMAWVAQYNGFTTEPIVVKGWTLVRDVCNMFFIFAMLLIAFGTILRIQAYHYRTLLFKVVLMAVLMNLSKSIAGVLIDLSQVVMLSFVSTVNHLAAGSLTQALGINQLLRLTPTDTTSSLLAANADVTAGQGFVASSSTLLSSYILAAVLMFLIFITILALVVTLVVRILKLWILVILSPLAFAGTLFKGVGSAAGKWWDELAKELVSGPTLMFFLWLVLAIAAPNSGSIIGSKDTSGHQSGFIAAGQNGGYNPTNLSAGSTANLVNLFVVVGLLWAGLGVAKAGGTAAAGVAGFGLGKLTSLGTGAARGSVRLTKYAGKRVAERTQVAPALRTVGTRLQNSWLKHIPGVNPEHTKQMDTQRNIRVERALSKVGMGSAARAQQMENKAVADQVKSLGEKGINDDATIRTALASNMGPGGKIKDKVKQKALLNKLAKEGVVLGDASDDIIKYTQGFDNPEEVQRQMLGTFKDANTTKLKAKLGGISVQDQVDSDLSSDVTKGDKAKRMADIDKKVMVNDSGNVADEGAVATMMSERMDDEYYKDSGTRQKQIDRAYMTMIKNEKDQGKRQKILDKFNEVSGRRGTANEVTADSSGNIQGDAVLAKAQAKSYISQQNQNDRKVNLERTVTGKPIAGKGKPLDESEVEWKKILDHDASIRDGIDDIRLSLAQLATLDPIANAAEWNAVDAKIKAAQDEVETKAEQAARDLKLVFRGKNGIDFSAREFAQQRIGGDVHEQVMDAATNPNIDKTDLQQRISTMNTGLSARTARVNPVYDKAARKTQKLTQKGSMRTDSAVQLQAAADAAFRQVDEKARAAGLAPVLDGIDKLVAKALGRTGLDPVQEQEILAIQREVASLKSMPAQYVAKKNTDDLFTRLDKLKNLT